MACCDPFLLRNEENRMKKSLIIGLLFLAAFSCSKSPEERISDLFQTGIHQVDRYELDAALATFKKIGEIDPSTPLGHYGSGLVFERQLQYYDALLYFVCSCFCRGMEVIHASRAVERCGSNGCGVFPAVSRGSRSAIHNG